MEKPVFLPENYSALFSGLTDDWELYESHGGVYDLRIPRQWHVNIDPKNTDVATVIEGDEANISIVFTYHPNVSFESTDEYRAVKDMADDLMTYRHSEGDYMIVRRFTLNGSPATMVERMRNVETGGDPVGVELYVVADKSYLQVAYSRYQIEAIDVPEEVALATIRLR